MGGEKYLPCFNADGFVGSPPRGQGKAVVSTMPVSSIRITPAWAGKSHSTWEFVPVFRDHPRVGGEKTWFLMNLSQKEGSPPRGRGKADRGL